MKWPEIRWRLWLSIVVGWMLIGAAYALNYYVYARHYVEIFLKPPTLGQMLVWELPYWFLWAAVSPLVFRLTQRFRLERGRLLRNSLIHVAACFALALAHRAVYLPITWALGSVPAYSDSFAKVFGENFFFNLPNGLLCYVTILLAGTYYGHYREEELKIARLKAERTQAELQALKMQLQPHFLFNTLNSISAHLGGDGKVAKAMLGRLGDFLRMTLESSGAQEVTLEEEEEFLRCYLEIQRARFSDRLSLDIEIAPETKKALVPNLILQPIVENAIEHGIMQRVGSGHVEIRSRREDEWLHLSVRDNGPGLRDGGSSGQKSGHKLGFPLTANRLERLYGTRQRFRLSDAPGGGLQVSLEIPFRVSSAAGAEASPDPEEETSVS
jgi:two-component system LytT family sensor kinase